MKISTAVSSHALVRSIAKDLCRRILATTLLAACHRLRVPRIDRRAFENLQRWASDEKDSWSDEF
ncbi:MAG: hypothetical protein DMG46_25500 [Acidobacteria bacterium]|nr:MAG: hypothetical protein DMG46_25500 [Acidobacteriota bacterium]